MVGPTFGHVSGNSCTPPGGSFFAPHSALQAEMDLLVLKNNKERNKNRESSLTATWIAFSRTLSIDSTILIGKMFLLSFGCSFSFVVVDFFGGGNSYLEIIGGHYIVVVKVFTSG